MQLIFSQQMEQDQGVSDKKTLASVDHSKIQRSGLNVIILNVEFFISTWDLQKNK